MNRDSNAIRELNKRTEHTRVPDTQANTQHSYILLLIT